MKKIKYFMITGMLLASIGLAGCGKKSEDDITNKEIYQDEILKMQGCIRTLTDRSMEIQAQEARNKQLMEQKFASVKKQVKEIRSSQKVVNQYYKNMMKKGYVEPHFLDNKKSVSYTHLTLPTILRV